MLYLPSPAKLSPFSHSLPSLHNPSFSSSNEKFTFARSRLPRFSFPRSPSPPKLSALAYGKACEFLHALLIGTEKFPGFKSLSGTAEAAAAHQ